MNKNYIYYGIGVAVVIGAYLILKPKKPAINPAINLDEPTLKTFVAYLYDRKYTVDQLPEDVKKDLTPKQFEQIKEALAKYKP